MPIVLDTPWLCVKEFLNPPEARMCSCKRQQPMMRHIRTPTQLPLSVSAKKSGATTRRRIKDPGISSQSGKCLGKKSLSTTAIKAIHFPTSPLRKLNSTEGRLKKIYGIKSDVSIFVLQFVRSNINRQMAAKEATHLRKEVPNPSPPSLAASLISFFAASLSSVMSELIKSSAIGSVFIAK